MFAKFQLGTDIERLATWGGVSGESLLRMRQSRRLYDHLRFPVLRISPLTGKRQISWMQEGLIPSYAHDEHGAQERSEARAEAYTTSSAFRCAFRRRRCIIPADVFNECLHQRSSFQVPCSFALDSGGIFGIAGVWESWINDAGHEVLSFAIVTGHVAPSLEPVFDRMPIVIAEENHDRWLGCSDIDTLPLELLRTLSKEQLKDWKLMPCEQLLEPSCVPVLRVDVKHDAHAGQISSRNH